MTTMNRTLLVLGTILRMAIMHPALALPAVQIQVADTQPQGPRIESTASLAAGSAR